MTTSIKATADGLSGELQVNGNPAFRFGADTSGQLAGFRNKIINGNFDIWQRGSSFIPASGDYTADRWVVTYSNTFTSMAVSRQSFAPGDISSSVDPTFFYRSTITTLNTATNFYHSQRIEDVRVCAGKTITVSFYAKADSARTLGVFVAQNFGSGGSVSVTQATQNLTLTTSWALYSLQFTLPTIAGKTIGTGSYLQISFAPALVSGSVLDLWGVQLEAGSIATPFEHRPYGTELALCQRYYETGYSLFAPGNSGTGMGIWSSTQYSVRKRATPTVTVTNLVSSTGVGSPSYGGTVESMCYQCTASSASVGWAFYWKSEIEL